DGNIALNASQGTIKITGASATAQVNIRSESGNINLAAYNPSTGGVSGVALSNVTLNATSGNIDINGTTPGTWSGVRMNNVNISAAPMSGKINVYGESKGSSDTYDEKGSVYFGGVNNFSAGNITIKGVNKRGSYNAAGMAFDGSSNSSFVGNTSITAEGYGKGLTFWNGVYLNFSGGDASVKAKTTGPGGSDSYYSTGAIAASTLYQDAKIYVNLTDSNLSISADSTSATFGGVPAFGPVNHGTGASYHNGFTFSGSGNVDIYGAATDGNGVAARDFHNTGLTGNVTITGKSTSGTGVSMEGVLDADLVNASITGTSQTGVGISVIAAGRGNKQVNLNGNTLCGTTESGDAGVKING
ncbi:TPA: hypothetical protein N3A45_004727, partial [Salmonella enterica subsp. salamae serovar [1],40:z35:e,n,x,z15]|nr:hypothetical protein [Salmonella enterica]HCM2001506.1 hypothetical protein [Salmonella enterica subsp. salamae serovar [1],40:z35:e,n,x,z15]